MTELDFDAIAMATIEENGRKTWIVHARREGKTYKLRIALGENQMQSVESQIEAPCA